MALWGLLFPVSFILRSRQNIAGLAAEGGADLVQRFKPQPLDFPIFQQRKIGHADPNLFGQFRYTHFPFCQHDIKIYL